MSAILLVGLSGLLALALWRIAGLALRSKPTGWILAFGILAAPLLVTVALLIAWRSERFGELRLTLDRVTAEVGLHPLSLGGDPEAVDILIAGLGEPVAEVRRGGMAPTACDGPEAARAGAQSLSLDQPVWVLCGSDDKPAQALVSIEPTGLLAGLPGGPGRVFPTAPRLGKGDAVCVRAPCETEGADWAIFDGGRLTQAKLTGGRVVEAEDGTYGRALPRRRVLLLFERISNWKPDQAIHPLRDHLPRTAADASPAGLQTNCERFVCVGFGGDRQPARSYLFQSGGFLGSDWHVVLADPGARIARGPNLTPEPYAPPERRALGAGASLSVWEPRLRDIAITDGRRGRLQLRRSINLSAQEAKVSASFKTPSVEIVGACVGATLQKRGERIAGARSAAEGSIAYAALGGRAARAANQAFPDIKCDTFSRASFDAADRAAGWTRKIEFTLSRLQTPWPVIPLAWVWAAIVLFAGRNLMIEDRPFWMILSVAQMLLALRLLIAVAGTAADPEMDAVRTVGDAAVAYVVVPTGLLTWAMWNRPLARAEWPMIAAPPAVVAMVFMWAGRPGLLVLALLLIWAVVLAWRLVTGSGRKELAAKAGGTASAVVASAAAIWNAPRELFLRFTSYPWLKPARRFAYDGVGLIVGVLAVRAVLAFMGVKERFLLPGAVLGVSVLYTPLLLIGFARLMAAGLRAPDRWEPAAAFLVLSLAAFVAMPAMVSDFGYALMLAPVAVFAAWSMPSPPMGSWGGDAIWQAVKRSLAPRRLFWRGPALILTGLLIGGPLAFSCVGSITPAEIQAAASNGDEAALALLDKSETSQNILRLSLLWAPEYLSNAGTAEAESLRTWSIQLADYTGTTWGRGFMSPPNLSELRAVQMTDNLSAVHLISPFGRLATSCLLILLMTLPLAAAQATRGPEGRTWREIAGYLALWSLFAAAAYMVLANLQLVPFTGRNMYLLAAGSGSDLLEATALLALAVWGVTVTGRARAREAAHGV